MIRWREVPKDKKGYYTVAYRGFSVVGLEVVTKLTEVKYNNDEITIKGLPYLKVEEADLGLEENVYYRIDLSVIH